MLWQKGKERLIQGPKLPKSMLESRLSSKLSLISVNSTHLLILGVPMLEDKIKDDNMNGRVSLIDFRSQIWHHFDESLPIHNRMLYSKSGIIQTSKN